LSDAGSVSRRKPGLIKSAANVCGKARLRHELFRGRLDQNQFECSERDVARVVVLLKIEKPDDVRF
jgi:hypothetical protein